MAKNNHCWMEWMDGILTTCNVAWSRYWFRQVTAPCKVACGSVIVTVNSPSGSNLQCDTWLWDDMPLNSPKCPPFWNSTSGFHFHISPQSTCHSVIVCKILSKLDHPQQKKAYITSYRSSIDTIALNCLVFEKIAFFAFWRQTDRQRNGHHRCVKPQSRCRELRLNNEDNDKYRIRRSQQWLWHHCYYERDITDNSLSYHLHRYVISIIRY